MFLSESHYVHPYYDSYGGYLEYQAGKAGEYVYVLPPRQRPAPTLVFLAAYNLKRSKLEKDLDEMVTDYDSYRSSISIRLKELNDPKTRDSDRKKYLEFVTEGLKDLHFNRQLFQNILRANNLKLGGHLVNIQADYYASNEDQPSALYGGRRSPRRPIKKKKKQR